MAAAVICMKCRRISEIYLVMILFWIVMRKNCMSHWDSFLSFVWNVIFSCLCRHMISVCLRRIAVVQMIIDRKIRVIFLHISIFQWMNFSHRSGNIKIGTVVLVAVASQNRMIVVMTISHTSDNRKRLLFCTENAESRRNFSGFFAGIWRTYCENST